MFHRLNYLLTTLFLLFFLNFSIASEPRGFKNTWEIGFTFGEIPILSGSFKPGLTVAYHFNEYLSVNTTYQLKDYLQRDDESFNAQNIGFDGLTSSKETTGQRFIFAMHYRPVDWSPYLIVGFVYNNEDIETMKFDQRERIIGDGSYDAQLTIVQKRESGFVPAIGFGYRYDFDNGISLNTNIAAGFFNSISDPHIKIDSSSDINIGDQESLIKKMNSTYQDNFHNHYHMFNLGVSYRFK